MPPRVRVVGFELFYYTSSTHVLDSVDKTTLNGSLIDSKSKNVYTFSSV